MRYLVPTTQLNEIPGRQIYLYDIFKSFFVPSYTEDDYIYLLPFCTLHPNILFIIGHADQVENYLSKHNEIPENTIVATTCLPKNHRVYLKNKIIFVPKIYNEHCFIHDGKYYGFSFNPTDAELNLYNTSGDIFTRIRSGYQPYNLKGDFYL